MFLDDADSQVTAIRNMCRAHVQGLNSLKTAISQFIFEPILIGKTYDSAKNYFQMTYIPVITGLILAAETLETAAKKLSDRYRSDVDENSLQEAVLRRHIEQLNKLMAFADHLAAGASKNSFLKTGFTKLGEHYQDQQKDEQAKLAKLMAFDPVSATLFGEVETLLDAVEQGLKEMRSGKGFSGLTGTFSTMGLNMDWVKPINDKWEKDENIKAANLSAEEKLYLEKAKQDHEDGRISNSIFESIKSGILSTGTQFIKNAIETKLTDAVVEKGVNAAVKWLQESTFHFMDRGLVPVLVDGSVATFREAPTFLSQVVRTGARYGIPIVGALIDYGIQRAQGESSVDAAIKTTGHIGAGMAIGSAIGGPIGTAVGFLVGVGGSMAVDWVYDHKDAIVDTGKKVVHEVSKKVDEGIKTVSKGVKKIGDAVSGFFGNLGSAFD
ncbi:T7SS effector LXG polymorphic toxin [Listeria grayi]|nr:T7SS effector LXG polymorphic toxin [Listeria grayi]